jgi:hypothetical protein
LIRYFPRLVCVRHNRVSGPNLRVAREWTKELCTSTPHLLWEVVAFTAVMVMGMLWLAWPEKQDSVLWPSACAAPRSSNADGAYYECQDL